MTENKVSLNIPVELIRSGNLSEMNGDLFFTLIAIASYMNDVGESCPTQKQLATVTGVTERTVQRRLEKLDKITINGKPIITRIKKSVDNHPHKQYTLYKISDDLGFELSRNTTLTSRYTTEMSYKDNSIINNYKDCNNNKILSLDDNNVGVHDNADNAEVKINNARDFITYFCKKYRETYDVNYNPNWGRDGSMIKNKLLGAFDSNQLVKMVDTIFKEYDRRWKNSKFPRPTIGQIVSWLANEALAVAEELEKEDQETQRRIEEAENDPHLTDEYFEKVKKHLLNKLN